MSLRVSIQYNF